MAEFFSDERGDILRVMDTEEVPGEEVEEENYLFKRLPRPPEGYPQCGCSLEDMAVTTNTGHSRAWRMHAFGPGNEESSGGNRSIRAQGWRDRHKDPYYCTRRGVIDALGTPMCALHAGQIALRIFLGEHSALVPGASSG